MKKKYYLILLAVAIIIIGIIIILNLKNKNSMVNEEIKPEEEITTKEERKTIISLYYKNKNTNKIEPEARLIDVKELMEKPYEKIMDLLLEGPKKENLEKSISEGTKINDMRLEGDTLIIDFSKEFIDNQVSGRENEKNTIDSIVKTFTELSEIDSIKILIDGEENKSFNDGEIKFDNNFIREE